MKKKVFSFNFCVLSVFFLHCGEKCRNLRLIQNVFEDQKDIMYSWKQSTYLRNIYHNELIEYIYSCRKSLWLYLTNCVYGYWVGRCPIKLAPPSLIFTNSILHSPPIPPAGQPNPPQPPFYGNTQPWSSSPLKHCLVCSHSHSFLTCTLLCPCDIWKN